MLRVWLRTDGPGHRRALRQRRAAPVPIPKPDRPASPRRFPIRFASPPSSITAPFSLAPRPLAAAHRASPPLRHSRVTYHESGLAGQVPQHAALRRQCRVHRKLLRRIPAQSRQRDRPTLARLFPRPERSVGPAARCTAWPHPAIVRALRTTQGQRRSRGAGDGRARRHGRGGGPAAGRGVAPHQRLSRARPRGGAA